MANTLQIPGLSSVDQAQLDACLDQLDKVAQINATRRAYFESKQRVQQLGIAIPPQLAYLETCLGWPYKAVKSLATRIKLTGFTVTGAEVADYGIDRIWAENRLGIEAHYAHMSALTYGVAFVAVLAGGPGEPGAVIRALSPTSSTALWDANKRRATAAVSITKKENGRYSELILYLEDKVVTCRLESSPFSHEGVWKAEPKEHKLGRCPVVVLAYDASPEYPFGRSRITQGVMRITDEAIRTSLRMEVSAEFYSTPQRYILGVDEEAFVDADGNPVDGFKATIGRMLALARDDEGNVPTVGTFPAQSMQPHSEMLKTIAAKFSGETNIPVNALGIIHENPASDAAMHTAYLDLNADAESAHEPFGAAWVDAMRMAVQIREGSAEGIELLDAKWRDTDKPTKASAADATMKMVQAGVLPPDSAVTLEQLGFDQVTIDRIVADRRKGAVSQLVSSLGAKLDAAVADPVVAEAAAERGTGDAA